MNITKQKGTRDIFGEDIKIWQFVESKIKNIAKTYNISEIRTPVFESTELFLRGVGDNTDIVNKEMYTFLDKSGRSITLRPELTAGVVRAYIENGFSSMPSPIKLWYVQNMYRYERMQKGRYREFAQFGTEIFGSSSYLADVFAISVAYAFLKELGIEKNVKLCINSIGDSSTRKEYLNILREYLKPNLDNMCETCKSRFNNNAMRIIDCKEETCKKIVKDAPRITDYLSEESKNNFLNIQKQLEILGIEYTIDKDIVRGLDYYNDIVYEFVSNDLGLSIGGGGRYDTLVETVGGPKTPATGFAFGMDRVILTLKEVYKDRLESLFENDRPIFFITSDITKLKKEDEKKYIEINRAIDALRKNGNVVETDISSKDLKNNLKYANKINAKYCVIALEDEFLKNICVVKDMDNNIQNNVELNYEKIVESIK